MILKKTISKTRILSTEDLTPPYPAPVFNLIEETAIEGDPAKKNIGLAIWLESTTLPTILEHFRKTPQEKLKNWTSARVTELLGN